MARYVINGFPLYQYDDKANAVWSTISKKFLRWSGPSGRVTLLRYRGDMFPASFSKQSVLYLVNRASRISDAADVDRSVDELKEVPTDRSFIVICDDDLTNQCITSLDDFVVFDSLEKAKDEAECLDAKKIYILEVVATATKEKLVWKDGLN